MDNEAFEKAMQEKFGWNNTEHILRNPDDYSETVHLCVYYSWQGWQAAQQQSAGEIKRLSLLRVKTLDELNQKLCNENDALKAENEKLEITLTSLRESLETIANESDPDLWQVKFAIEALYATNLEREK